MSRPGDRIESLLKLAGERDRPSEAGMEKAREAARAAWLRGLEKTPTSGNPGRRGFTPWLLAAAASVMLMMTALWFRGGAAEPVSVARVAVASGALLLDGRPAVLAVASLLMSGSEIRTRNDPLALRVGDALSLRLHPNTRLRFDEPGRVTLLEGSVYVDSGGLNAPAALRIGTPAGEVRHVGTQFQVAVNSGGSTQVNVREGRVLVARPSAPLIELAAGDRLTASASGSRIEHGLPGFGAEWDWAAAAAPLMDIENRPLSEFLGWYTREHGWQLRFADAGLQARSVEIRLHGSLAGLDTDGSLEYVGLITGVPLQVRDGVLWAGKAP